MPDYNFYVYITTNPTKTVLYVGVSNDLSRRMVEHFDNRGNGSTFAGKYYCYNLVYYEHFMDINYAIKREKEIKKWNREKKNNIVGSDNAEWRFLNEEINGLST